MGRKKQRKIKAWVEINSHLVIQKEAIGQLEIYDKKKNGIKNPWRVNHSTKLVKCEIILKP